MEKCSYFILFQWGEISVPQYTVGNMHLFFTEIFGSVSRENFLCRRLGATMLRVSDFQLMVLQLLIPWGSWISYGLLLACTLKFINTLLGELSSLNCCSSFDMQFTVVLICGDLNRSDVVEIETWCQGEGRIGTRRDWILKDYATGQVIGRATRCTKPLCFHNFLFCKNCNEVQKKHLIYKNKNQYWTIFVHDFLSHI